MFLDLNKTLWNQAAPHKTYKFAVEPDNASLEELYPKFPQCRWIDKVSGNLTFETYEFEDNGQCLNRSTVRGELYANVEIPCDRCGEMFAKKLVCPVTWTIVPKASSEQKLTQLDPEQLDEWETSAGVIDLVDMIYQSLDFVWPDYHRHSKDTKGCITSVGFEDENGTQVFGTPKKRENPFEKALGNIDLKSKN